MEKLLKEVEKYLILAGVLLFAVFTLPGFPSPFFIPKEILASVIISLALIASLTRSILKGELKFALGKFDAGVVLLSIAYLVASIIATPNKMEAFFYPGITTFVLLSAIFYLIINQFTKRGKNSVLLALFASGILLSVSILFTKLGVFAKIPQLPGFMKDSSFNPLGSNLHSVIYLLALLPIGISQILKESETVRKMFFGVASSILIFGIIILGVNMLPGKPQAPVLPSWQTSWEITVETLKKSPLLGAGPGNYLSAFNLYKPLSYNGTDLWQVRFSSSNNYYFTLITELGLIGLAALVILLVSIYKKLSVDIKNKNWEALSIVILVLSFAVLPVVPSLIFLFMVLLSTFSGSEEKSVTVASNKIPSLIVASPILLGIIALAFFGTKAVAAEATYQKSLNALVENNAKNTYDNMVKAVSLNPYVDRYHASLAQVEMALANSLAEKKDLTDEDRTTITQLVQQAISEGKATVTLNLSRSGNWEVLAQIYRSIMSFAEGSDQFAIQTYTQAVALDPLNPELRIALGGVHYALEDYDSAIGAFQLATVAKSDYANSHYNLAAAYAAKKDYDKAIAEMDVVLSLISKDSEDYKTAQTVMDQLKAQKAPTTEATSQNLTAPETVEETNVEPPITLPSEATPPASP
jgi:tetratricopeptide (TPR) repeat protein